MGLFLRPKILRQKLPQKSVFLDTVWLNREDARRNIGFRGAGLKLSFSATSEWGESEEAE